MIEEFNTNPYGYLCCINNSMLYTDSIKQTFSKQKELHSHLYKNQGYSETIEQLILDPKFLKQATFLNENKTGIVLSSCQHLMHYDCLLTYKTQ